MGRPNHRLILRDARLAILIVLTLQACSSSNPAHLSQAIDAPSVPGPEALLPSSPGAQPIAPVPGGIACATAADCDDQKPCTEDLCLEAVCHQVTLPLDLCCVDTTLQMLDFDEEEAVDLDADAPIGGASWSVSDARAVSAPASLYFGDTTTQRLGADQRVIGAFRLPRMTLPVEPSARLSMRLFVDIESDAHRDRLTLFADLLDDQGGVVAVVPVLTKEELPPEAYAGFALVEISLSDLAGETLRLRFDFDSVEAPSATSEGVFIDDLEVTTICPESANGGELTPAWADTSETGSEDPGDPRDRDRAAEGADAGESGSTEAAGSGPESRDETGQGGQSSGSLVSGGAPPDETDPCAAPEAHDACCTSDADCDDGDPATVNICEGAECVAAWSPDGCESDADCSDAEPCTVDRCEGGSCVYEGTFGSVCCEEGAHLLASFDAESLQGIFVTDNLETGVFWRPDPTRATSGDFALYCGDPIAQTYGIGERVKSSATTPPLSLPVGGNTQLLFDLFMVTRADANLDVFQVFVLREGVLNPVWSSKALAAGNTMGFLPIAVDLSSFAGQTIQLRFVFDSVDDYASAMEGTYIDSLRLDTTCL